MTKMRIVACVAAVGAVALMTGCRVENHKDGNSDNVKIATPFGGMSVKTNDNVVIDELGLPVYPGAAVVKKDKDNGAADVNMSFGKYSLRVKAVSFTTTDKQEDVLAFYRKGLSRYGDVIECHGSQSVGLARTSEGLTCDKNKGTHITTDDKAKLELKAGSNKHQHIVAIEESSGGMTKFGVVALDLPGEVSSDDGDKQ